MGCSGSVEMADREAAGGHADVTGTVHTHNEAAEAAAAIGGALGTFSLVELSISAKGLVSMDTFSASDPVCIVYEQQGGRLLEIGRTEAICTRACAVDGILRAWWGMFGSRPGVFRLCPRLPFTQQTATTRSS
jgi:hypothetical protein